MRNHLFCSVVLTTGLIVVGCGGDENGSSAAAGGVSNVGGSTQTTPVATGGTSQVISGTTTVGSGAGGGTASNPTVTGGTNANGGVTASGGSTATGQTVTTPNTTATGGTPGNGGTKATGGTQATGGNSSTGGTKATGGTTATGGTSTGGTSTATTYAPGNYPLGNAPVPSAGCGKTPTLTSGAKTLGNRKYIIRIPDNYDKNKPSRLVFGMHWMGGKMEDVDTGQTVTTNVWSYFGLKQLDTEKNTIFVAPNGNNCGTWCKADETFVDDMVKQFESELCIDQSRIFTIGFSFGAIFSYSLGCDRPNIFRGVVTQAPASNIGCNGGTTPVAYMSVVGMADTLCTPALGRTCRDTFVTRNGCTKPSTVPEWTSGNHICYKYEGCKAGYPVEYCTSNHAHIAAPWDGGGAFSDNGNKTWVPAEAWKFITQF